MKTRGSTSKYTEAFNIEIFKTTYKTFKFTITMSSCFILMLLVYCILIGHVTTSKPLSILLIDPVPSLSHHVWTINLMKGLLRKGHHVHVVSTHETKIKDKLAQNLTYDVSKVMELETF